MTAFNVYRREVGDPNSPVAIAIGLTSMSYSDGTAEEDKIYLYSIGAVRSGLEKISNEVTVSTLANDPHWGSVTLLVDAESGFIKDWSLQNRSLDITNASVYNLNDPNNMYEKCFRFGGGRALVASTTTSYLATNDFTAETLADLSSINPGGTRIFCTGDYSGNTDGGGFQLVAHDGYMVLFLYRYGIVNALTSFGYITINKISHITLMRKNQIFYVFVDGVLVGQSTSTYDYYSVWRKDFYIGADINKDYAIQGSILSFRLTEGISRYPITGFTPPIKFPNF